MDREEILSFGSSAIDSATGLDDLHAVLYELRDRFAVAHLTYHTVRQAGSGDENILLTTADPAWRERYLERGYISIDPAVIEVRKTALPVDWGQLDRSSSVLRRYFKDLDKFGFGRRGYSIPCFSAEGEFGVLAFSADHIDDENWRRFSQRRAPDLAFLGQRLHVKVHSINQNPVSSPRLTPQGKRLLSLLAQGHAPKAIAGMTNLSIHTVRMHLDNAQARLGCRTKAEAVKRALDLRLISTNSRMLLMASLGLLAPDGPLSSIFDLACA
ncbi:helix-turn-helix transcriptional regulator [Rhizobium mesosinicum]|uniref:Autoinducer binding domain-containing protein n=1 Tax=Rhizobium mesosinicum TaxID=335017 RepID=A0ABS7GMC9_9HYPH|nr:autoinducer binding domain-containing protein [Rhizobium mesosinicum]MBW9051125.1 autoinducer binding domain-containing protein [Rhizobium mesosinicum]